MIDDRTAVREYQFANAEEYLQAIRAAEVLDLDYVASRTSVWEEPYQVPGSPVLGGSWHTRWVLRITSTDPKRTSP